MVSLKWASLAVSFGAGVFAAPKRLGGTELPQLAARQSLTQGATGTNNGFYYSFYIETQTGATYTNGADGEYSLTWTTDAIDVGGGKGWETGSAR